jgi:hypothetical protein
MFTVAYSLSLSTVEPIDWAAWKLKISAPGVVEQMQKDYEALNFPTIDPMTAEARATVAAIEAEVVKAKKAAVHGANEVRETEKVIDTVHKMKKDGLNWTLEEWQAFIPGLEKQQKDEYNNEEYLVSDDHLKLEALDWKGARKEFAATGNCEMGEADENVGDMNVTEEKALIAQGTWSIARVFASREERAKIQTRVEKALSNV